MVLEWCYVMTVTQEKVFRRHTHRIDVHVWSADHPEGFTAYTTTIAARKDVDSRDLPKRGCGLWTSMEAIKKDLLIDW